MKEAVATLDKIITSLKEIRTQISEAEDEIEIENLDEETTALETTVNAYVEEIDDALNQ